MDTAALKTFLGQRGYRMTAQRLAILKVIAGEKDKLLSARQIYAMVKRDYPGIGITTVYKTLHMLEQLGLLYKYLCDRTGHYEVNDGSVIHCYLICQSCGAMTEVRSEKLEHLSEILQNEGHFLIQSGSINYFGYCAQCRGLVGSKQ
jgi:Fur family ferric uptake transcriptional regulator